MPTIYDIKPRFQALLRPITRRLAAELTRSMHLHPGLAELDQDKLVAAMTGLQLGTPFGPITYRAIDHQSTMGTFVGQLGMKDGKGYMKSWRFVDGKDALPSDDEVKKMRPAQ